MSAVGKKFVSGIEGAYFRSEKNFKFFGGVELTGSGYRGEGGCFS